MGNVKKTTEWFVQTARELAPEYGFDKSVYGGMHAKIVVGCPVHGEYETTPSGFIVKGARCRKCYEATISKRLTHSQERFLVDCSLKHGDRYDYSNVVYVANDAKIRIVCPTHGPFVQLAESHRNGSGCPKCALEINADRMRLTKEQFITAAKLVHGDKYDYSKVVYSHSKSPVVIVCPEHQEFSQAPNYHVSGKNGCPKCVGRVSKQETEVADYLRELGLVVEIQNRNLISPAELDIYLPELKVAIEFNGAYWHADDRVRKHTCSTKRKSCKAVGVRLISIFDFEWRNSQPAVKATLNAMARLQVRLGARQVKIRPIIAGEARKFLDEWHVAKFVGAKLYLGAFHNEILVAVATFGASRFKKGEVELLRYASSCHLVGGLRRVVKRAQDILNFDSLTSYCDLRYGTGKSYENSGFTYQCDTPPDYWWFKGSKYYTRYAVQKHKLATNPDFSEFYSADKTEKQIMESAGFRKISGAGHSKWLFTPKQPSGV